MEGGGGAGGCLLLLILLLIVISHTPTEILNWIFIGVLGLIILIGFLIGLVVDARITLLVASAPFWIPHFVIAWLGVFAVRNALVREEFFQERKPRDAVYMWLVTIPEIATIIWFIGAWIMLMGNYHLRWGLAAIMAVISTALLIGLYYYVYFEFPPGGSDWPRYIAAEKTLKLEGHLWYIEHITRLKLWWQEW